MQFFSHDMMVFIISIPQDDFVHHDQHNISCMREYRFSAVAFPLVKLEEACGKSYAPACGILKMMVIMIMMIMMICPYCL